MTTLATRIPVTDPDEPPIDRLQRLTPEQFRLASEAGAFPEADRVVLADGLLRRGGPGGPLYRLSLDQFHGMYVVPGLERVELLEGWLVARMPIRPPHRLSSYRTRVRLEQVVPEGRYYVDQYAPSTMPRTASEPQPVVQVIRSRPDDYRDRHPAPGDIALLVEVSDATVSSDRNFKLRLYAREGVSPYWLLNLVARRLEVYTGPSGPSDSPSYSGLITYGPDDHVPLILDGREVGRIPVRDLLP